MEIEFTKCHGSGNAFVLVGDPREVFHLEEQYFSDFARKICRDSAVSSDGLLVVQKSSISGCDSHMRMFNPDGTEAEICGNGLRCVARETMDILGKSSATISTCRNTYHVNREEDLLVGVYTVSVEMGKPTFEPKEIPINCGTGRVINQLLPDLIDNLSVSILGMPNPHIVAIVKSEPFPIKSLIRTGEIVNNPDTHMFPKGGNVSFVKKIGENELFVATYERGAGLTLSCGSGMAASSIVACMLGEVEFDKDITVYNQGGYVKTWVNKDPSIYEHETETRLTGNATYVLKGKINYTPNLELPNIYDGLLNLTEAENYLPIVETKNARIGNIMHL